jgi:hypothetical protein
MKVRLLAALVAVLALAGCGGSSHPAAKVQVTADRQIERPNHGCKPGDFVQQCKYARLASTGDLASASFRANGIDFAWSCGDPQGYAFGASYLSPDGSKNWSPGCVQRWRAAGRSIIVVWESSADRAGQGYWAGHSDAQWAVQQANALGITGRPIFFAIDYDADGGQVVDYFNGVRSVLPYERTGAYGGIRPLEYLHNAGVIKYGWQAFAWSYGQWGFSALRQVQNGDAVDWDLALAADYGQWPYSVAPPPDPYRIFPKQRFDLPFGQRASEYNTVKLYEAAGCHQPWRRQVCKSSGFHARLLRDRIVWVAHHQRTKHGWVALRKAAYGRDRLGQRLHRVEYDLTH